MCGALASVIAQLVVKSYVVSVSTSTHVLEHIAVPQFDTANPTHTRLAPLSQQAHQLAAASDEVGPVAIEAQVDKAAAELWGITDKKLKEIRRSLEELGQVAQREIDKRVAALYGKWHRSGKDAIISVHVLGGLK